jgi:hypothetical protein
MTVSVQFKPYNLYLPTSDLTFAQMDDVAVSAGLQEVMEYSAGGVEPGFIGAGDVEPVISWSTKDLEKWAAVFTGAYSTDNETKHVSAPQSGACLLRYQAMRSGSTEYASGASSHFVTTIRDAITTWSSIAADHGGMAAARMQLDGIYDGTNTPISNATGQTLSGGKAFNKLYTLGPVKLNGSFVNGVFNSRCESGANLEKLFDSGLQYPTFASIGRVRHAVAFDTNTITLQNSLGYIAAVSALIVYYRRRTQDSYNYSDASTEHIKITYGAGTIFLPRVEGSRARAPAICLFKGSPTIQSGQAIA